MRVLRDVVVDGDLCLRRRQGWLKDWRSIFGAWGGISPLQRSQQSGEARAEALCMGGCYWRWAGCDGHEDSGPREMRYASSVFHM